MEKELKWIDVKPLPSPHNFSENIGVSDMLCEVLDNKVIIGGGINYQSNSSLISEKEIEHRDLYLVKVIENSFKVIDRTVLEKPVANGKAVIFNNIMFYIGGNRIVKINVINNKLHISEYFKLPFEIKNCIAHQYEGIIYYGLGEINGEITNRMFCFNIFTRENIEINSFPATKRTKVVSEIFNDDIVVFSGGNLVAYTDGYKFNIKKRIWQTISDVEVDGEKISIIGAGSSKINDYELLVIGGFDEKLWNETNEKFSTLKGEDLEKFKNFYYTQDYSYYNWNKKMLIYNYEHDFWRNVGEISFNAPCGNSVIHTNLNVYSIMGEIKPKEKTPNIYRLPLMEIKK